MDVRKSKDENDEMKAGRGAKMTSWQVLVQNVEVSPGEKGVYLDWEWSGQDRQRD